MYPLGPAKPWLDSALLEECGTLEFSVVNTFGQQIVERSQLIGVQAAGGLLQDALVALGDLLQEIVDVRLRAQKGLVGRPRMPWVNSRGSALMIWMRPALCSALRGVPN